MCGAGAPRGSRAGWYRRRVTRAEIVRQRLEAQCISATAFTRPGDVIAWLGAVQAQDYLGAPWAVGLRCKEACEQDVERALAERKIVTRTTEPLAFTRRLTGRLRSNVRAEPARRDFFADQRGSYVPRRAAARHGSLILSGCPGAGGILVMGRPPAARFPFIRVRGGGAPAVGLRRLPN
jgi:hypothetical protein